MKTLKIIFAGTPEIARIVLDKIIASGFKVDLVLTKPDSEAHRGKKLQPSQVKELALSHNIPVLTPISLKKDFAAVEQIRGLQPDIMVVIAYGLILPQEVLDIPRLGCVNIHVSLLPRHRGAAPIQRTVQDGDAISGITLIQMDSGLDTGDILLQKEVLLDKKETSKSLHDKLALLGAEMIVKYLHNYKNIKAYPQSSAGITYAHKLEKHEAAIDWNKDAVYIERQIRAFNPFPGSFTLFNGEMVKIWDADLVSGKNTDSSPGTIVVVTKDSIVVQTTNGLIAIKELQFPGKKRVLVSDYLNGISAGIQLQGKTFH